MAKVLFTSPCQPYPVQFNNVSLTDVQAQRLTQQQDIFTLTGHAHCMGMHLIARNISVPSVILEYPTWEHFEKEVRKGYDFIGIGFFQTCTDSVLEMCKMIRRLSPRSKIVLGHYGALAFNAFYPEDFKKEHADYICIGDGIKLFRELLGEPVDAPLTQGIFPRCGDSLPWLDKHPRGVLGFALAGLGCPSGCDFCATTEMHGNQRVKFFGPEEVFKELKRIWRTYPDTIQIGIYDEDWLKYPDEVREVGRLIQEDTEFGLRRLNYFALSSVESLSQYEFDELPLLGFKATFVGVESKFAPQEGYEKRRATLGAKETTHALLNRGISCATGLMLGFDFHDRVNILEDIEHNVACEPTVNQVSMVCPFPGTPLWYRLKEEDRLYDTPWIEKGFYGGGGNKYKNFEAHELENLALYALRRTYETWGPSLMRQLKVELNGYDWCRATNGKDRHLKDQRAELHRETGETLYPLIRACEYFAPNGLVRRRIRELKNRYVKNFGKPSPAQEIMSYFVLAKAFQEKVREAINPRNRHPKEEPFKIYLYEKDGKERDGIPYKVVYPVRDRGYEFYNSFRGAKEQSFKKVLDLIDSRFGTGKSKGVHDLRINLL